MVKAKNKQTFEVYKEVARGKEVILYGCGKGIREALKEIQNVKYICDSDSEKWGEYIDGIKISSPNDLYYENVKDIVIVITAGAKYVVSITNRIQKIDDFNIFYWDVLTNEFLQENSIRFFDDFEKLKEVERYFNDSESIHIFREIICRRIIGSTAEYEALPNNIKKIENRKKDLYDVWTGNLEIIPYAVSDKEGVISFCETKSPGGSFSPEYRYATKLKYIDPVQILKVQTCTLDDTISKTDRVTLIKMDIEGMEYEALKGAEIIIKKNKPRLAISIYHNAMDYWRICELIKEYVPEYKIAIRHHKQRHVDTVLYAWTEE